MQLSRKPEVPSAETSATASDDKESEESEEKGITRKQRKEILCDTQEKQERTLFLGNLPVSCATDKIMIKTLKARFIPYGKVESIRFRSIPFAEPQARRVAFIKKNFRNDGTGGTCNGYIVMETREASIAALKENATIFADRHLRVDLASEGEGSTKTNTKKSIFIGNLPMDLEEEPVWQLFGKCGTVSNVRLIRDKVTNMGKGIGYVTFTSKDSVDVALKLAGTKLGNRPVRVSPCSKIGMVEKKKARANSLAEIRQKRAAALVKASPAASTSALGAAKSSTTDIPFIKESDVPAPKKVSKKDAKLQAELQTKFGQLFHKKFPFAQAISEVEKTDDSKKSSSKKSESSKSIGNAKPVKSIGKPAKSIEKVKPVKSIEKKTSKSIEKKPHKSVDKNSFKSVDKNSFKSVDKNSFKSVDKKIEKTPVFKPTKIISPTVRAARVEKSKSDFKKSSKKH